MIRSFSGFAALTVVGVLFLLLPFLREVEIPMKWLFVGRLHPLVLHFPIVLIILAFLFEVASRFYRLRVGESTVLTILIAAAVATLLSVGAGFLLYAGGEYSGELMDGHLWFGSITGAMIFFSLALYVLHRVTSRYYFLYFFALLGTNLVVGYASHLGGSITHGEGYLTEHLQLMFSANGDQEMKAEGDMLVFEDMLLPVFEARCVSCHNPQRAKGGLVMTSYASLFKGGRGERPAISRDDPWESEVYRRVILPDGHSDRMPPEGKSPMSDPEIALLKYWIASGAADSLRVDAARDVDTLRAVVEKLLPAVKRYQHKAMISRMKHTELKENLSGIGEELGVNIREDSLSDESLFALSARFPPSPITDDDLRLLRPYREAFSKLAIASCGIDDADLYYISQMPHLRELYLQKNPINGTGIIYLQNLQALEVLNLSFTQVDDKAVLDLLKIPNLKEVYLYRTKTSMQVIEALRKYRPSVKFLLEEGPYN